MGGGSAKMISNITDDIFIDLWYQTTEQIMEKDILNYSPTVMFRGTPCI